MNERSVSREPNETLIKPKETVATEPITIEQTTANVIETPEVVQLTGKPMEIVKGT